MTDDPSDAELHMEHMVDVAMNCKAIDLSGLSLHDMECVLNARLEMAGLMLLLELLLAGGLRPQP